MAKNKEVIEAFVTGGRPVKTKNLKIVNSDDCVQLVNYSTVLAEINRDGLIVNVTKYSRSTSTIQKALRSTLDDKGVEYYTIENVAIGARSL